MSAASPTQIASAAGVDEIAFLVPRGSGLSAEYRAVLAAFGTVLDWEDESVAERWCPDGITTFSENLLIATAELAEQLGLRTSHSAAVRLCGDKAAQRKRWHDAGLDRTRFVEVSSPDALAAAVVTVGLPCVVKPRRGTGSRNVFRVENDAALTQMLAALTGEDRPAEGWIVEELLSGVEPPRLADYVSVEVVADGASVLPLAVTSKLPMQRPFREQGGFVPGQVDAATAVAVTELAAAAVTALGLTHGLAHVEIKLTQSRPSLVEVNPRLGGYQENLVGSAGGRSLVRVALDSALGRPLPKAPLEFEATGWWFAPSAPVEARAVRRVAGFREISKWPCVAKAHLRAPAGTVLDWRAGWGQYVALFEGASPSADEALDTIDEIRARLVCEFEFDDAAS